MTTTAIATRRPEPPTSLLTLFILSPTVGTMVAAWRGVKRLHARYRERATLEGRALGLRHRPYGHAPRGPGAETGNIATADNGASVGIRAGRE